MSSFVKRTLNPKTGNYEDALWLDDYYGNHRYGVKFMDGMVWNPEKVNLKTSDDEPTSSFTDFPTEDKVPTRGNAVIYAERFEQVPVIESGIPIPPQHGGKQSKGKYPFEDLKVGDSFIFPHDKMLKKKGYVERAQGAVNYYNSRKINGKQTKKRFTSRVVGPSQVRVWRIK